MISFNMKDAELPGIYQGKGEEVGYDALDYVQRSWTCNLRFEYKERKFLNLEVGEKYYKIIDGNLVAFKVKSLAFCSCSFASIFVEIVFPNGRLQTYSISSKFFNEIFLSVRDYKNYQETNDNYFLYQSKISIDEFFEEYVDKGQLEFVNLNDNFNNHCRYITIDTYSLNKYNIPKKVLSRFEYLWIDKDGLHYSVFDNVYNRKYYRTEEECLKSSKIIDFDDDNNNDDMVITLSVKIKKSQRKFALDNISKFGFLVE